MGSLIFIAAFGIFLAAAYGTQFKPRCPARGARSVGHWTTREVPRLFLPFVSKVFVIAHWSIFMMDPLKYFQIILASLYPDVGIYHLSLNSVREHSDARHDEWFFYLNPNTLDTMWWNFCLMWIFCFIWLLLTLLWQGSRGSSSLLLEVHKSPDSAPGLCGDPVEGKWGGDSLLVQNEGGSSPSLRGFCHRNGTLLLPTWPPAPDTTGAWRNKAVVDILSLTRSPLTPSPVGGRDISLQLSGGGSPGSPPGLFSPWWWGVGMAHYHRAGSKLPLPTCPSLMSPPPPSDITPGRGQKSQLPCWCAWGLGVWGLVTVFSPVSA